MMGAFAFQGAIADMDCMPAPGILINATTCTFLLIYSPLDTAFAPESTRSASPMPTLMMDIDPLFCPPVLPLASQLLSESSVPALLSPQFLPSSSCLPQPPPPIIS